MLRWITAGESHGPALVAVLEGMVAGVEVTTDRPRRAARPPPARVRAQPAHGVRDRPGRVPRRRAPRADPGRAGRGADRQRRVAQVGEGHVRGSRGPRGAGRARPQRAAHPAPARARRPRRHAEVRLRRRAARCSNGPARGRPPPGPRWARSPARSCASCSAWRSSATSCRSAAPRRRTGRCRGPRTSPPSTRARCVRSTLPAPRRWSPRSRPSRRPVTPSAASSRSSSTGCRRAWARTCTGTAGSTRASPPR